MGRARLYDSISSPWIGFFITHCERNGTIHNRCAVDVTSVVWDVMAFWLEHRILNRDNRDSNYLMLCNFAHSMLRIVFVQ